MLSRVYSFGLIGIDAYPIEIDIDVSNGLPIVNLVGLADTAVKESRQRVKSAVKNSGFCWPVERITISLAPSHIKKEGASFDLAIALGILAATGQTSCQGLDEYCIMGELSLDGSLRPIHGVLPIALAIEGAGIKKIILPQQNGREASIIRGISVFPVKTLKEAIECLNSPDISKSCNACTEDIFNQRADYAVDFSEVKGQYYAKRALEVAVSGGHNILMIGPPGSGKTMLAKRIPTIMPDLTLKEALEVTKIHSVAGTLSGPGGIMARRPFRSPHHTISHAALVGGGTIPRPGEISLAHQGVLFLDELAEFRRDALEALRQPLEEGVISVSRAIKSLVFPASFILAAATNPCPCGALGQLQSACRCGTTQVARYRAKLSGPLLDRIDIHIEVPAARYQELTSTAAAESSSQIKARVDKARAIQRQRLKDEGIPCNALMSHKQVRKFCGLDREEGELLKLAMTELNFSARAYDKILKVSRSIADLAESGEIKAEHLSEAIQYRSLDRGLFV